MVWKRRKNLAFTVACYLVAVPNSSIFRSKLIRLLILVAEPVDLLPENGRFLALKQGSNSKHSRRRLRQTEFRLANCHQFCAIKLYQALHTAIQALHQPVGRLILDFVLS